MTRAPLDHDMPGGHQPVMLREVLAELNPRGGGIYVDGTFGAGGYARALLEAADCTVWGIDRDPDAIAAGAALAERHAGRLHLVAGRFGEMAALLNARGVAASDGVALDIGVSSMQLDRAERGFSFRQDGPLDMRMERRGESAADLVNGRSEQELADIIFPFGEERRARAVARASGAARPLTRTAELAAAGRRGLGYRQGQKSDPATRTFQAIRIHLNAELDELEQGLRAAERVLRPGGRLAVVTFHSLEDRIVKRFLKERSGNLPAGSRHRPQIARGPAPTFEKVARPVAPSERELARNPRARSARLRTAVRTAAPAWDQGGHA